MNTGLNIEFPIYNADGTPFNGLVLRNATFDSVVMSLGDKITGDVYYKDNTLAVTMSEYIEYKRNEDSEVVKFVLVNPPTVVREGIVSDNSELRGMTKYSFVFYHPMYAVSNFPFTDVAVSSDEQKYLSNSKTFNWIGNLFDMVAKLNKNLQGTQWMVGTNIEHYEQDGVTETSMWQKAAKIPDKPLSFDKTYVSEVLKTSYETWEIPFVVDQIAPTDARYAQGKRFLILFGTPSNEILDDQDEPYIFRFGQGVGLKNNSRTPKNNKIVTRIVGYGSENNIPFGYPQIQWFGDQTWKYTINNQSGTHEITLPDGRTVLATSYPIYKGILGGRYVNLIKHPFTRRTLMPSVYRETLFNKVSPYMPDGTLNQNFDPTIELVDYYDADGSYVNPVVAGAESVEIHQFEDIKPEFTEHSIVDAFAYDREHEEAISYAEFTQRINALISESTNKNESYQLTNYRDSIDGGMVYSDEGEEGGSYTWHRNLNVVDQYYIRVRYTSDSANFNWLVVRKDMVVPATQWDDTMNNEGEYKQSYFKMTLPQLDFDLYACASITEEMKINMRSGACIGCTFDIAVDWDDYKNNFYDSDGNFLPDGEQRDLTKYPKTNLGQVTFVVKKDLDTFGTLMPNTYQQPHSGDEFVILGISLPTTYVTNAEARLDDAAKEYMRENNVHYYEYPLKFDEHFLATHVDILSQIHNNTIVRFQYGIESPMALYVKQITVKYSGVLPTYDITLTDDVEIVLNQIGQVTDDVSRMRVQVSELQKYYSENIIQSINEKLSKVVDDVCQGCITFQQGLVAIGNVIFHDELRSPDFASGLYSGKGWRIDKLGNAEMESLRVRSYLEVVELLINRVQAQEGDTAFTDNDQIDRVDVIPYGGVNYYLLSLKEKWSGYITSQQDGNVIRGVINTLAAKESGISNVEDTEETEHDGDNSYYTSWMQCVSVPHGMNISLGKNQILTILYGDSDTPSGTNFPPCELMTIVRWGCSKNPNEEGISAGEKESRRRRQNSFYISTTEGRIMRLVGVNKPKLDSGNYGSTLGELPDFVKDYTSVSPLIANGGDFLYAQGIVVENFIKIDKTGTPVVNYVDKGDWQTNTIYLVNEYNENTGQYETHDVWHNDSYWRCRVHQPVNGIYYEPTETSPYWEKLLRSGEDPVVYEIETSSNIINADANGNVSTGNIEVLAYKTTGNVRSENLLELTSQYYAEYSIDGGTWESCTRIRISLKEVIYGIPQNKVRTATSKISIRLKHSSDTSKVLKDNFKIQVVKDGAQGGRGKAGRILYFAGVLSDVLGSSFDATDNKAPYVNVSSTSTPLCYMYVGANGSGILFPTNAQDYQTSEDWEIMVSDFKYLIAEAVFGSFAHFGSAVISVDWMISTHGKIGGQDSTEYEQFRPDHPTDTNYFVPNYAVNLSTGDVYMAGGALSVVGNELTVIGTIKANNFFHHVIHIGYGGNSDDHFVGYADVVYVTRGGNWPSSPNIEQSNANSIILPDPSNANSGKLVEIINTADDKYPYLCTEENAQDYISLPWLQTSTNGLWLYGITNIRVLSDGTKWIVLEPKITQAPV